MEKTWMAWFIRRFESHTGFILKLEQQYNQNYNYKVDKTLLLKLNLKYAK